ncbi:GDP-mannose 4,6-dehydratase [soil metagenome]
MKKIALITGISGQDGSYLAELLLTKNYRVIGLIKNSHSECPKNLKHLQQQIEYIFGDLSDPDTAYSAISQTQPDEVYNLASQSYPGESWASGIETIRTNGLAAHSLFNSIRHLKSDCKIYQASSSEMFGEVRDTPQNEQTPFNPINPYAAAKLYAHNIANIYRKSYSMFISCGILFNHESERRGIHFITQKVTYAAACLKLGIKNSAVLNEKGEPIVKNSKLLLGNLNAQRDWGFAGDFVEAMWLMLQQPEPDDFIIGTGKIRTIKELCETAFSYVNLNWKDYVDVDLRLVRPTDTGPTVADPSKAKKILGWEAKTSFNDLIASMVEKHLVMNQS